MSLHDSPDEQDEPSVAFNQAHQLERDDVFNSMGGNGTFEADMLGDAAADDDDDDDDDNNDDDDDDDDDGNSAYEAYEAAITDDADDGVADEEEQDAQRESDDEGPRQRTPTRRFAVRRSPPGAPLRVRTRARTQQRIRSLHAFQFGSPMQRSREAYVAQVQEELRVEARLGLRDVFAADGARPLELERGLAQLELAQRELAPLYAALSNAAPYIVRARAAVPVLMQAADTFFRDDGQATRAQIVALRRAAPDTAQGAFAAKLSTQLWSNELRQTVSGLHSLFSTIESATELLMTIDAQGKTAAETRATLSRISHPAESDAAAIALLGTFAQRSAYGAADDDVCVLCQEDFAKLSDTAVYRVNSVCTLHDECAARTRLCRCATLFCQPCLVRMMRHTYAEQRGEGDYGVTSARATMQCPTCRLPFCFADMQRIEHAVPVGEKRAADAAAGKTPVSERVKRRRRRVAPATQ